MKTVFKTMDEITTDEKAGIKYPLNPSVIPNYMGINLCSVEGMSSTKREDGQLTTLTIHFSPSDKN